MKKMKREIEPIVFRSLRTPGLYEQRKTLYLLDRLQIMARLMNENRLLKSEWKIKRENDEIKLIKNQDHNQHWHTSWIVSRPFYFKLSLSLDCQFCFAVTRACLLLRFLVTAFRCNGARSLTRAISQNQNNSEHVMKFQQSTTASLLLQTYLVSFGNSCSYLTLNFPEILKNSIDQSVHSFLQYKWKNMSWSAISTADKDTITKIVVALVHFS